MTSRADTPEVPAAVLARLRDAWPGKARFYGRVIRYLDEGRTALW